MCICWPFSGFPYILSLKKLHSLLNIYFLALSALLHVPVSFLANIYIIWLTVVTVSYVLYIVLADIKGE